MSRLRRGADRSADTLGVELLGAERSRAWAERLKESVSRATETMWWWDPADRADRAVDGGGAPGKTKGVVASGARAGALQSPLELRRV